MRIFHSAVCVAAVLALAACKSDNKSGQDVLAQDSTLSRDLQLANHDSTAQPQLKDVPTTPPPAPPVAARTEPRRVATAPTRPAPQRRTVTPAPAPPPAQTAPAPVTTPSGNVVTTAPANAARAEARVGMIAAGTSIALATGQRVCTNTNTVGDRLTATLAEAVTGSNGVVIPAGATAVLEVTSLGRSTQAGENMNIGLVVRSITYDGKSYPVNGEITSAQTEKVRGSDNNDAGKVVGGAAVGAILGRIFSGKSKTKGTVIGAAGGAAAGAILANQTAHYDACIPSGGRVTVKLDSPMSVQATGANTGTI